jgi:hypothetical protein
VEIGDKLGNRHGSKGVVSQILPDDEMPKLQNGTPVDLVYSFIGMHTRQNHGQVLEAAAGMVARASKSQYTAPPLLEDPEEARRALKENLNRYKLPDGCSESLYVDGRLTERPVTFGLVYWGLTRHLAKEALANKPMLQGEMEYAALKSVGAYHLILEQLVTKSVDRITEDALTASIIANRVETATFPSPLFERLADRLNAAGIDVSVQNSGDDRFQLRFKVNSSDNQNNQTLPFDHPWMPGVKLGEIGCRDDVPESDEYGTALNRYADMVKAGAPDDLLKKIIQKTNDLGAAALDALVNESLLKTRGRAYLSAKSVLAPTIGLQLDQVGIPEEMAWHLFGPTIARFVGADSCSKRTSEARQRLDEAMSETWVLINRAPTVSPTSIIALKPVRTSDKAIHIHPAICPWLGADFDGDQAAIFLPITKEGQIEAEELLSISAHVSRDSKLLSLLMPTNEALWGLASTNSLGEVKQTEADILNHISAGDKDKAMTALSELWSKGWTAVRESGASMVLFPPATEGPVAATEDDIIARWNPDDHPMAPQLIAVRFGARGNTLQLAEFIAHISKGMNPDALHRQAVRTWGRFMELEADWNRVTSASISKAQFPYPRQGVLVRAMRSPSPGIVFGRAAVYGEIDQLDDVDSRLFVGLMP